MAGIYEQELYWNNIFPYCTCLITIDISVDLNGYVILKQMDDTKKVLIINSMPIFYPNHSHILARSYNDVLSHNPRR